LSDWISAAMSGALAFAGSFGVGGAVGDGGRGFSPIGQYFQDSHPLLTDREKLVLTRRFRASDLAGEKTLEEVGLELGVSKERVRQLQVIALGKLRKALHGTLLTG
jgi:Sigma-70, region 4